VAGTDAVRTAKHLRQKLEHVRLALTARKDDAAGDAGS
jgi:hypothetical protein